MNNLSITVKETNETLSVTRDDITGYFPNEADGTYINIRGKTIIGTKLEQMFKEWKDEVFGLKTSRSYIDAGIGLKVSESGVAFRFFGYKVDNSKISNMTGFEGEVTQHSKCFDIILFGDIDSMLRAY